MDSSWVELRVHGVSGTPPEAMLDSPTVVQVAGDDYSRYFTTVPRPTDRELEAYHWGRFTSGSWRHALTLMFLPFGMVNAAPFMLPPGSGLLRRVTLALLRVLGLLLTALFAFALGLILIDMIGWRWSPRSGLLDGFSTGVVLPVAVLLAAAGMGALSVLNQPGFIRTPALVADPGPFAGSELRRDLYRATWGARLLRRLHVAAGLLVIAVLADQARTGTTIRADGGAPRATLLLGLLVVVVMVAVMSDPRGTSPRDAGEPRPVDRWWARAGDLALLLAIGAVLAEAVAVSRVRDLREPDRISADALARLVRFDDVADGLMLSGLVVLGLLAACTVVPVLVHRRRDRPTGDATSFRPYAWGLTPFLVSTLAVFVAIGFSAAAATAIASTLEINADDPSGGAVKVKVGSTLMLDRVAYAWGLTVFLVALIGLAVGGWYLATRRRFRESVDRQFWNEADGLDVSSLPAGWRGRVARGMFVARLKNAIPAVVITFVVIGIAISAVQAWEMGWIGGRSDAPAWPVVGWLSNPRGSTWSVFVINVGAWALVAGAGAIVALSRGALKDSGLRRGINVVWDVFGFWPHVAHPFGPEPYSRWTVMELTRRIRHHLERRPVPAVVDGGPPPVAVVVGAHSQGTVVTLAALLLLTQAERDRVALLSCGSQLRVIYPRAFPAFFGLEVNTALFASLHGRWVNLYRTTDPLAGPVLSWAHTELTSRHLPLAAPDDGAARDDERPGGRERIRLSGHDWRLIDPVPSDAEAMTGPVAALHGHHDYWGDSAWEDALVYLRGDGPKPHA